MKKVYQGEIALNGKKMNYREVFIRKQVIILVLR